MSDVFKVVYEVPADHPAVTAHYDAVFAAAAATWAYVESIGALSYHTSGWDGSLYGVVFREPDRVLWKVQETVWHDSAKAYLCVPKKIKAAEDLRKAFDAVPKIPKSTELAQFLGWTKSRREVCDGNKIYFATVHKIDLPHPRVFVRLPRQIDDGWEQPDFFIERTEGEYMRAIAAHNALVPKEDSE